MKKMLAAVIATVMMTFGLVATVSTPAQAACPYSSCIPTTTTPKAKPSVRKNKGIRIKVTVTPQTGTGTPVGQVRVRVKKKNGGYLKVKTVAYNGGKIRVPFKGLKVGNYVARARFIPGPTSVYLPSKGKTTFNVRPGAA